jgi:hypothetical protein
MSLKQFQAHAAGRWLLAIAPSRAISHALMVSALDGPVSGKRSPHALIETVARNQKVTIQGILATSELFSRHC